MEPAIRRPDLAHALVLVGPTVDPAAVSLARQAAGLLVDIVREPLVLDAVGFGD